MNLRIQFEHRSNDNNNADNNSNNNNSNNNNNNNNSNNNDNKNNPLDLEFPDCRSTGFSHSSQKHSYDENNAKN